MENILELKLALQRAEKALEDIKSYVEHVDKVTEAFNAGDPIEVLPDTLEFINHLTKLKMRGISATSSCTTAVNTFTGYRGVTTFTLKIFYDSGEYDRAVAEGKLHGKVDD